MSIKIERRRACCALAGAALLGFCGDASADAEQSARPFCRFSIADGWADYGPAEYITHRAGRNDRSGVPQVVKKVLDALSTQANIEVFIAEHEDNAFATVANTQKILVVDVGFLEKLNTMTRTRWAAIQVIAHELGHHIAGFAAQPHRNELNADYWSGQSLQRLGAAKAAATRAIMTVGTEFDTPSHPNKYTRAATIEQGWDDAAQGRVDYNFCLNCR